MERTALYYQIDQLRNAIVGLRSHLDDTLGRIENFDAQLTKTAEQAREVSDALWGGRPRGSFVPFGFLGFLGLGVIVLAIFSPQTLTRWYDDARRFADEQSRRLNTVAREQFGEMPPR